MQLCSIALLALLPMVAIAKPITKIIESNSDSAAQQLGNVDCAQLNDGNFAMLNENSCSKMYITCDGGLSIIRECPGELRFDSVSGDCLSSVYVEACGGVATTTQSTEDIMRDQPTKAPVDFECVDKEDGFYASIDRPCSDEFFSCVGGVAELQKCATSILRFDVDSQRCLFSAYVSECGGEPTEIPPFKQQDEEIVEFSCESVSLGNHPNPNEECSAIFYSCIGKVAGVRRVCGEGTYFDGELNQCLFHSEVPACSGTPRPPPKTEEELAQEAEEARKEEEQKQANAPKPVDFDCSGLEAGNYADPKATDGCSQLFYSCNEASIPSELSCAGETYYDQELKVCMFHSDVPECSGTPRPPPKTAEELEAEAEEARKEMLRQLANQRQPAAFDCTDKADGNYLLDAQPCSNVFYQCVAEFSTEISCPTQGLRFSTEMEACVSPRMVDACKQTRAYYGASTTSAPTQQTVTTTEQPLETTVAVQETEAPYAAEETATIPVEELPIQEEEPLVTDPASCVNGYDAATRSCLTGERQRRATPTPSQTPTLASNIDVSPSSTPTLASNIDVSPSSTPTLASNIDVSPSPTPTLASIIDASPEAAAETIPGGSDRKQRQANYDQQWQTPAPVNPATCSNGYNAATGSCIAAAPVPVVVPVVAVLPVDPVVPAVDPSTCRNGYNAATRSCIAAAPVAPVVVQPVEPVIIEPVAPAPSTCRNGYNPATRTCFAAAPVVPIIAVQPTIAAAPAPTTAAQYTR